MVVNGYSSTNAGTFYDSELVFGGEGNGEETYFNQMNAKLLMWYVLLNGSVKQPYTYYFYINGSVFYNFTTYSSTFSGKVYLPPLKAGNYTLQAAVQDSLGRKAYSSSYELMVNPGPSVYLKTNKTVTDAGLPLSISIFAEGGTPPYSYSLYINGKLEANGSNAQQGLLKTYVFVPEQPGKLQAEVLLKDSAGYTLTGSMTVNVNPDPAVSAYSNVSVTDIGLPVKLISYASSGTPPYSFTWYIDGKNVSSSQSFSFITDRTGPYSVLLVFRDSAGFTVEKAFTVNVNADPELYAGSNVSATDSGLPVELNSHASFGTPPYSFSWQINGQKACSTQNCSFVPNVPGRYYFTVTLTDSAGYIVTYNLTVNVNPDPQDSISYSRSVTDAGLPVFMNTTATLGTPPYSFTWYVNGQQVSTDSTSYSFGPISAGSYSVTATVTDSIGYSTNSTSVITVNSDPKFTGMTTSTSSNNLLYSDDVAQVSVEVQGGTPPYNYTWYLNGNPVATTASPFYNYSLPLGQNSLQVRVVDSVGYSVASEQVPVSTSYNYLSIGAIAAIIVAAAVVAVVFLRRRT